MLPFSEYSLENNTGYDNPLPLSNKPDIINFSPKISSSSPTF